VKLSQIGEFGLIEILKKMEQARAREDTVIGMGDDAAVLKLKIKKSFGPSLRTR
jgi:thiamine monophosphate kinase